LATGTACKKQPVAAIPIGSPGDLVYSVETPKTRK